MSSAAGRPPYGGIGGSTRNLVGALLRLDPETHYQLAVRPSRGRRGHLFRPEAPNASIRISQDPWNALLLRGARLLHAMSTFLPRTPRIPKLVTIYDVNPVRNPQWVTERWRQIRTERLRVAISRADHLVATSRFAAGEIAELFEVAPDRIHVVPLGVDARAFRPLGDAAVAPLRERWGDFVLAVGVLTGRKNLERLVQAVAGLAGLRVVVVGRASSAAESFRAAAERAKIGDRLIHLERVSHADLVAAMNAARAVVVPSLYEGFGLTVLEAMACGTPVVCSNASSLPEVASDAALLVDARDPGALADAIARVLASPELARDLRERGLARARELSWERAARTLRALYRDLAGV